MARSNPSTTIEVLAKTSLENILLINKEGYIVFQSESLTHNFGYPPNSMLATSILSYLKQKDQLFLAQAMENLIGKEIDSIKGETTIRDASDHKRYIHYVAKRQEQYIAWRFFDITAMKKKHKQQLEAVYIDDLTQIPNIKGFERYITNLLKRSTSQAFTIFKLDINDLKVVNDMLGRDIGDQVLISVVKRIENFLGHRITFLARLEEDAFGIVVRRMTDIQEIEALGRELLKHINGQIVIQEYQLVLSVSIGAGFYPEAGQTYKDIMLSTSQALQIARQKEEEQLEVYTPFESEKAYRMFTLRNELLRAIEQQQFTLYYQPIVCAKTSTIISAEALIRWIHPVWKVVPPNEFIPALEETGLIIPLGEWIVRSVCEQLSQWHEQGYKIRASLNMSAVQLFNEDIVSVVKEGLVTAGVDPSYLTIEITETIEITKKSVFLQTVENLRALGVNISLDDFGAGYSSFSKILDLKPHVLKLDRSMINDIETDYTSFEVTTALVSLAHRLNMQVVAEGIETATQQKVTADVGCDLLQGFLFSRPIPSADFLQLLATHEPLTPQ
ncbi:MAG TPA: bifunctional diguanylate cyclase/phosphodiesterase [Metalysinibacillus jejuensis]|uniref:Bifunctional diguanylate cyclase/phosphodiesterase n=1 Tax=Metalysinibacillus jejuensis TaxID=914327 RepID=A0A921NCN4_9BACL|nr:bifunctional diguanylate cyclase/phosphodiesterase [Metalysinibacillus jejuensis]